MLKRLLPAAALLLLLTSRAEAAPINLLLSVNIGAPNGGPPQVVFGYSFFESATYGWPGDFVTGWPAPAPVPALAAGGGTLLPGQTQFNVSLNVDSLEHVYFIGSGWYFNAGLPLPPQSFYVAEPPTGDVSDQTAWAYGPPWISLANLGAGISDDFRYVNGAPRAVGTYQITAVIDPAPVPEPASLFLLGSGLAAVAAKRYRQSREGRQ